MKSHSVPGLPSCSYKLSNTPIFLLCRRLVLARKSAIVISEREAEFYGSDVFGRMERKSTQSEINLDLLNSDEGVLVSSYYTRLN